MIQYCKILGLTAISDTRGAGWGHLYGYLPHSKLGFQLLKEAFPGRLSSIHFMKPPMVVIVMSPQREKLICQYF